MGAFRFKCRNIACGLIPLKDAHLFGERVHGTEEELSRVAESLERRLTKFSSPRDAGRCHDSLSEIVSRGERLSERTKELEESHGA